MWEEGAGKRVYRIALFAAPTPDSAAAAPASAATFPACPTSARSPQTLLLGGLTTLLVIFMVSSFQDTVKVLRIPSPVLDVRYGPCSCS